MYKLDKKVIQIVHYFFLIFSSFWILLLSAFRLTLNWSLQYFWFQLSYGVIQAIMIYILSWVIIPPVLFFLKILNKNFKNYIGFTILVLLCYALIIISHFIGLIDLKNKEIVFPLLYFCGYIGLVYFLIDIKKSAK